MEEVARAKELRAGARGVSVVKKRKGVESFKRMSVFISDRRKGCGEWR